jgi:deazaflavin-dependent oxidoreductase (nitroreductase family)
VFLRLEGYRWFAAFARRIGARVERLAYKASGGRVTFTGWLMPLLLLTTNGRRSGSPRTTPLMYVRDGSSFIVSSENFGQSRPAAWPLNLDADPRARVQLGRQVIECRARRLDDQETEGYWPALVEAFPAHETYRERSGVRHTFALEPVGVEEDE